MPSPIDYARRERWEEPMPSRIEERHKLERQIVEHCKGQLLNNRHGRYVSASEHTSAIHNLTLRLLEFEAEND